MQRVRPIEVPVVRFVSCPVGWVQGRREGDDGEVPDAGDQMWVGVCRLRSKLHVVQHHGMHGLRQRVRAQHDKPVMLVV